MSTLPRYSSSLSVDSVPLYSPEPSAGEQRLDHTAQRGAAQRPAHSGVRTQGNARMSIILTNQDDGAALPTYGRNDAVKGMLHLKDVKDVTRVSVKLDGVIDVTVAEGSSSYTPMVTQNILVWQAADSSSDPVRTTQQCPEMIQFECTIPPTFRIGERTRPLPPSFDFAASGVPGLFAKCKYVLTVEIAKRGFWKRNTTFYVPFIYHPHTRPHRPMLPSNLTFMSTFKESPEEWHQVVAEMQARPQTGFEPIQGHLFIPAAQVYAISDAIPFHVQLCAPLESLHALTIGPLTESSSTKPSRRDSSATTRDKNHIFIRVFLLRQIIVCVHGQRAWRTCTIGEGALRPLPRNDVQTMDWEGEVQCDEGSVNAGGFNTGNLVVKDFIVLALYPPYPTLSPLFEMQHAHPIRIVTDPWTDIHMPEVPEASSSRGSRSISSE